MNYDILLGLAFGVLFGAMGIHILWLRTLLKASLKTMAQVEAKTLAMEIITNGLQRRAVVQSMQIQGLEGLVFGRVPQPRQQAPSN